MLLARGRRVVEKRAITPDVPSCLQGLVDLMQNGKVGEALPERAGKVAVHVGGHGNDGDGLAGSFDDHAIHSPQIAGLGVLALLQRQFLLHEQEVDRWIGEQDVDAFEIGFGARKCGETRIKRIAEGGADAENLAQRRERVGRQRREAQPVAFGAFKKEAFEATGKGDCAKTRAGWHGGMGEIFGAFDEFVDRVDTHHAKRARHRVEAGE